MSTRITITISSVDGQRLEQLALNRGMASSGYVRFLVERHLEQEVYGPERRLKQQEEEVQIRRLQPMTGKTLP